MPEEINSIMDNQGLDLVFRPKRFNEVCGNQEVIMMLENHIIYGTLPSVVLLHGQPGVAKTTLSFILTSALLCKHRQGAEPCLTCETCRDIQDSLYLNGSAMRGMDIYTFDMSSHETSNEYLKHISSLISIKPKDGEKKIIIVEELHKAEHDQQENLNKILEFPPKGVYVIICTSILRKVAKAIQKRCLLIPLNTPDTESLLRRMRQICVERGQTVSEKTLLQIVKVFNNNGRQCVKTLQEVFNGGDIAINALLNQNAVDIEIYLAYFRAVKLGIMALIEFVEDTLKEPARFFGSLDDYIYTVMKSRYSASFVIDAQQRKDMKAAMDVFTDTTLVSIMKFIKNAGYVADSDAKKYLFVIGFEANPKIVETVDYPDSQNYALTKGSNSVEESSDFLNQEAMNRLIAAQGQATGVIKIEDL